MAQFSVKIIRVNGAVLDENQHPAEDRSRTAGFGGAAGLFGEPVFGSGSSLSANR
jgi:hypothetical protein